MCIMYSVGIWCVVPKFRRARHSCSGAVVLVMLPISSAQWVEITAVLHLFRAAWAFGVLFLLVFCENAFLREGRGRGSTRLPRLGFSSGIEKKSRNEVRDLIRPNYEIHTTHLSRLSH